MKMTLTKRLGSYRKTRDIIFDKIKDRFQDYILIRKKPLFFIKIFITT